jgi:hypothetical protein
MYFNQPVGWRAFVPANHRQMSAVKYFFALTTIIIPVLEGEWIGVVGLCGMWKPRKRFPRTVESDLCFP